MVVLLVEKLSNDPMLPVWIQLQLALGKNSAEFRKTFWSAMVALLVEKSSNDPMLPGLNPSISGIG